MLVLTRRVSESLKIGDNVEITALEVSGGQVSFGIIAPKNIQVHRKEVYLRIQAEKNLLVNADSPSTPSISRIRVECPPKKYKIAQEI